jgi:DNA-binding MarR family transcriptional regulator
MGSDSIDAAKQRNLGNLLLRSARLFDALAFERWSAGHPSIRRAHLQLMPHLDLDGTRITELARRAEISKQAVGQLVTDMEAGGYVERVPDPSDQRAKIVVLTKRGRDAVIEGLSVFDALKSELIAELGAEVIEGLIDGLERLSPALDALGRAR